jgi:hypothetical protein
MIETIAGNNPADFHNERRWFETQAFVFQEEKKCTAAKFLKWNVETSCFLRIKIY